jgi:hypothetical protein
MQMEYVEIMIRGRIDEEWSDWFGNLDIHHTHDGNTLVKGSIRDQSALHGLLSRLPNLGLQLMYVTSEHTPANR